MSMNKKEIILKYIKREPYYENNSKKNIIFSNPYEFSILNGYNGNLVLKYSDISNISKKISINYINVGIDINKGVYMLNSSKKYKTSFKELLFDISFNHKNILAVKDVKFTPYRGKESHWWKKARNEIENKTENEIVNITIERNLISKKKKIILILCFITFIIYLLKQTFSISSFV